MNNTGAIVLPSLSAAFLWEGEIVGQLSDGMWENTAPHDHWKFWCDLSVKVDANCEPHVEAAQNCWPDKTGYNIAGLYEYVGNRMLATGRMGLALSRIGMSEIDLKAQGDELRGTCDIMAQMRYTEFLDAKEKNFAGMQEYQAARLAKVSLEVAASFYSTVYTMRELRKDVKDIKSAMKSASNTAPPWGRTARSHKKYLGG